VLGRYVWRFDVLGHGSCRWSAGIPAVLIEISIESSSDLLPVGKEGARCTRIESRGNREVDVILERNVTDLGGVDQRCERGAEIEVDEGVDLGLFGLIGAHVNEKRTGERLVAARNHGLL